MSAIAVLFAKYVRNGTYAIEEVPAFWRTEVEQILAEEEVSEHGGDAGGTDEHHRATESAD